VKIIAHMGGNKYLAEIDSRELRELNSEISAAVGAEYEITRAAETLYALRGLSKAKLTYLGHQIHDLQKKFDEIQESYHAVMLFDHIKNDHCDET
jgi:predicted  nucleic acid-binding Zn-ribbon protein